MLTADCGAGTSRCGETAAGCQMWHGHHDHSSEVAVTILSL